MSSDWKLQAGRTIGEDITVVSSLSATAFRINTRSGKSYFAKTAPVSPMVFKAEAAGLRALSETVKTPAILLASEDLLLLEWIAVEPATTDYWRSLGNTLAQLHMQTKEHFGFSQDGFIGMTPQANPLRSTREIGWTEYFIEYRLKPMLHHPTLATDALLQATFAKSEKSIRVLLDQAPEEPCLVHGDLWSGNVLCGPGQTPYFVDPAAYFGHREVDMAMSELFGGFAPEFYTAYENRHRLNKGYATRKSAYNLYHLLNHWILFGESYRAQVFQAFRAL
jgi:protein-ribulosamine 3-kinase